MKKRQMESNYNNGNGASQASGSLEDGILEFARSGELAEVARNAIQKQHDKGLPITFRRGSIVVKQYPDGREEVLAEIGHSQYCLPKDVEIIGKI